MQSSYEQEDHIKSEDGRAEENQFILFRQFFEAKQKFKRLDEVFDLVKEYEELCNAYLTVMTNLQTNKSNLTFNQVTNFTTKLKQTLKSELFAWRLIRTLYEDRLKDENMDTVCNFESNERVSDKQVIEKFYENNANVRQMQLVIDCLELNEHDQLEEENYNEKIQFYSEKCGIYENTLHLLKTKGKFNNSNQSIKSEYHLKSEYNQENLCTSLDPDAAFRERGKEFHDLDKEDENRLMKHIFRFLRAGRLDIGKKLAEDNGHHWLSACLDGWLLQHDAFKDTDFLESQQDEQQTRNSNFNLEGNSNRDLWKYACWQVNKIQNDKRSIYEKAIFGLLSGNVNTVLPLCNKWEDKLWAYFRTSIDAQIELELRETISSKQHAARNSGAISSVTRYCTELPPEYWENLRTKSEIFKEVESKNKAEEVFVSEKCFYEVIKYVVLNDLDVALEVMIDWIQTRPSSDEINNCLLRFFVHFVLFCKEIDLINTKTRENLTVTILESYIGYLIELRQIELIATYVSQLPKHNQIITYAKLLAKINDKEQRELCIRYGKEANLDIELITKTVVENIRVEGLNFETDDSDSEQANANHSMKRVGTLTNEDDLKKIDALDWLFFSQIQYIELLLQSNALMRYFILRGKVEAAKTVFLKLPVELIDGIHKEWRKLNADDELPAEIKDNGKEYLCFKSYFAAIEAIDNWFKFYHNSKPEEPKQQASNKFSDKVAYSYAMKNYESELKHWHLLLIKQAKTTSTMIYDVLVFAESGEWMSNHTSLTIEQCEQDGHRLKDLVVLRRIVIPEFAFSLYNILHTSNLYKDCFELINVIANEKFKLYKEFNAQQLGQLLTRCRESSIMLLNESNESLGYSN